MIRGIENTSGPLGQGHVFAVGAAIAAKFLAAHTGNPSFAKEKIYAYISDGGIQEEISQGGARVASMLGLDNLIMFYDANNVQLSTTRIPPPSTAPSAGRSSRSAATMPCRYVRPLTRP